MSRCAIPGCTDPCRARQLMCRWHWRKVTAALQEAVLDAWRVVNFPLRADTLSLEQRLAEIATYRAAVKAAVDHVCKLEGLHAAK